MVDLAREAYFTKNYDLAADIYERTLKVEGGDYEVYLGLANSLARSSQLRRAFAAYKTAFDLGNVNETDLNELVEALINMVKQSENLPVNSDKVEDVDMFSCNLCKAIMTDPVTLMCGHSFCRKCLAKEPLNTCKKCSKIWPDRPRRRSNVTKTNVLLQKLIERWFPKEMNAVILKDDGNRHFVHRRFEDSIEAYTEALKHAPNDHIIVSNRSHAYATLENYQQALDDAEQAIKLRPDWSKAYFRKAAALAGLKEHEKAAFAYLQCLSLDPCITSAKSLLAKEMRYMFEATQSKNADLETDIQEAIGPSQLEMKHFGAPSCSSVLNRNSLEHLKSTLRARLEQSDDLWFKRCGKNKEISQGISPSPKNMSAPNSRPGSPLPQPRLPGRAVSDQTMLKSVKHILEQETNLSRKRSREDISSNSTYSPKQSGPEKQKAINVPFVREVDVEKLRPEDFECSLCFRLLYMPVTTPCGHSFCRQCLDRCLDHTTECPLCKGSLTEYLAERRQAVTEALDAIIRTYLPTQHAEREKQYMQEMELIAKSLTEKECEIPIFVCTLAFPSVTCPLHVFEPRYRLMIRRSMESGTRQFGMCITLDGNEEKFSDYGTLLEVRDVQYFPDGRSVVDTIGAKRFKVLSRSTKDGYHVAKVAFLKDKDVAADDKTEVSKLCQEVFEEAKKWFGSLNDIPRNRILQYFGAFPEVESNYIDLPNGPAWIWWITAVLPLDQHAQLTFLAMTSLKERLTSLRRVLNFVQKKTS